MKVCSIFSLVLKLFSRGDFEKAMKEHKDGRAVKQLIGRGVISDHDLERYYLGVVTQEEELAPLEEHLLWCQFSKTAIRRSEVGGL